MNIEPKFKIGDKVFIAESNYVEYHETCPDCLGSMAWSVKTPYNDHFEIPCGTCMHGYFSEGFIRKWKDKPLSYQYTISGVKIDTTDKEHPIVYVCEETYSNGGGRLYYGENVFDNEQDAKNRAAELTAEAVRNRQERENYIISQNKKKTHKKPSFEQRKIKELEKEIKSLNKLLKDQQSEIKGLQGDVLQDLLFCAQTS